MAREWTTPTPGQRAERLSGLVDRLRAGRRRLVTMRLLSVLVNSLLTAVVAVTLLLVLHYFTAVLRLERADWLSILQREPLAPFLWQVALAIFGICFLLLGVFALTSVPSIIQLARRADMELRLDERISTALEVQHLTPRGPVHGALMRDAAARLDALTPRRLVPMRVPRSLPFVLLSAVVGLAVSVLPAPTSAVPAVTADPDRPLSQEVASNTAVRLRRLAQEVADDAESRSDEYLRAVAQSFEELASRVEGEPVSRTELERELGTLLTHATNAYGPDQAWAVTSQVTEMITSEELSRAREAPVGSDPAGTTPPTGSQSEIASSEVAEGTAGTDSSAEADEVESLLTTLGVDPKASAQSGPPNTDGNGSNRAQPERGGYWEVEYDLATAQFGLSASERQNGVARNSDGASDQAGGGRQALAEELPTGDEPPQLAMGNEEVTLPETASAQGRRIEVTVPTASQATLVADSRSGVGEWRTVETRSVARELVGIVNRSEISAYFVPTSADEDEGETAPVQP